VGVPTLTAWHIEQLRADRQAQQLDQPRCFAPIRFGRKERAVFQEIVVVERRLPPLTFLFQKKTGSR
jgi:hypothetical protein